jgi:hypothetical protein
MRIIFYKSSLCPRCYLTRKALLLLIADIPEIEVEYVDVLAEPGRTFADGIRMIPALRIGKKILSGIYLSKNSISLFLTETGCTPP